MKTLLHEQSRPTIYVNDSILLLYMQLIELERNSINLFLSSSMQQRVLLHYAARIGSVISLLREICGYSIPGIPICIRIDYVCLQ